VYRNRSVLALGGFIFLLVVCALCKSLAVLLLFFLWPWLCSDGQSTRSQKTFIYIHAFTLREGINHPKDSGRGGLEITGGVTKRTFDCNENIYKGTS